jgi:uncharacterized Zn-finger protein
MIRRANGGGEQVTTEALEIVEADGAVVRCDGGGGALGHPAVYLNMGDKEAIDCPFCSRLFVRMAGGRSRAGQ